MIKPVVNILNFKVLYNILFEIKDILKFDIKNYDNEKEITQILKKNNLNRNLIILAKKKLTDPIFNSHNSIILDDLPINFIVLLDKINTRILKQKYSFQSNLVVKNYIIDINSRIIFKEKQELKLTEKEIEIILFIWSQKKPQSIVKLQKEVWGYSENLETHTVETHIYRLRKKISDIFKDPEFLKSPDKGYII